MEIYHVLEPLRRAISSVFIRDVPENEKRVSSQLAVLENTKTPITTQIVFSGKAIIFHPSDAISKSSQFLFVYDVRRMNKKKMNITLTTRCFRFLTGYL